MSPLQLFLLSVALLVPPGLVFGWWRTRRRRGATGAHRIEQVLRMEGGGRVMVFSDLDHSFIIDHPEAGALVVGSRGEPRRCLYSEVKAVTVVVDGAPVSTAVRSPGGEVQVSTGAEPAPFAIRSVVLVVAIDDPARPEQAVTYFPIQDLNVHAAVAPQAGGEALRSLQAARRDHAELVEHMRRAGQAPV